MKLTNTSSSAMGCGILCRDNHGHTAPQEFCGNHFTLMMGLVLTKAESQDAVCH